MAMLNARGLRGFYTVINTPYTDEEAINCEMLRVEIEWEISHGVDGLTIALASEIIRLISCEGCDTVTRTIEFCGRRGPVVVSIGGDSTVPAGDFARVAEDAGTTAVMAIPPLSIRFGEDELCGYFEGILQEVSVPLVIQDASAYLGCLLSIDL